MRALAILAALLAILSAALFLWLERDGSSDAVDPSVSPAGAAEVGPAVLAGSTAPGPAALAGSHVAADQRSPASPPPAPGTLAGRVLLADGTTPAAFALVGAALPQEISSTPSATRGSSRSRERWTHTDESGAFEFTRLPGDRVVLHAELGPLLARHTEPMDCADGLAGVRIVLPESGDFSGRVLVPEHVDATDLRVRLRRAPESANEDLEAARPAEDGPALIERLDGDGSFEMGAIALGRYALDLIVEPLWQGRRIGQDRLGIAHLPLGEVIVVGAGARRTFDARPRFPGTLRLTLRSTRGEPARPTLILTPSSAAPEEVRAGPAVANRQERDVVWNAAFDIGPLPPGEWVVSIQAEAGWRWTARDAVRIEAGQLVEHEMVLPLIEAELQVHAPDGGPARGREFLVTWTEPLGGGSGRLVADERGRIRIAAPAGGLVLAVLATPEEIARDVEADIPDEFTGSSVFAIATGVAFEVAWTASGPEPAVLWLTERR